MIPCPSISVSSFRSALFSDLQKTRVPRQCQAAFTILEALVVIAVIGIVASLAIVFMNRFHEEVLLEVRNQRNAQEIAALAMGATAVGAEVIAENDSETTILNLIEGRNGKQGPFRDKVFRLSYLTPEEIQGAMNYLNWQGGMICYIKD